MKITKIHEFFHKVGRFQVNHRWAILIALFIFTTFGIFGLKRVKSESDNSGWFEENDIIELDQNQFESDFGNSETIGVLVEAKDVFDPKVLTMIKEIGEELEKKVPYADKVTSLTELEVSIGTTDGMEIINPCADGIPQTYEQIKAFKELILSKKSIVDKLVSKDCTETWISLSLLEYPPISEWEHTTGIDPMYETGEEAIKVLTDPKWKSDKYTIKPAGMPYTETEEKHFFEGETKRTIGIGFLVMILLLAFFLKSFRGVIIPIFSTIVGILVVFGFMGWFSIMLQTMMVFLPVMMGMALAVGYSVHLVNSFKKLYIKGISRKNSVIGAVEHTGWSLLFTVLTTMGSMASFAVIDMAPVRWMGLTCTAVVLSVYIYVMILVPILFSFGREYHKKIEKNKEKPILKGDIFFEKLGNNILNRKKMVIVISILVILLSIPGILKINVNLDNFDFMGLKIPYINRVYSITQSKLGSYITYNLTVRFDELDAIKDPQNLKKFETLLDETGKFELTKKSNGIPKIISILDILKEMNQTMHSENTEYYKIPNSKDMISQLLFLYEMSGGSQALTWVDNNYSILRAQIEVSKFEATEIEYEMNQIKKIGSELFPEAKTVIVGGAVRFAEMNGRIVWAELKSFLTAMAIILTLLSFVFSSAKTGIIGIIPNLFPVIILGGIMGYAHFQLDMMTMMIMPMLLGIAVDDTIHFTNRIKFEFELCGCYREAIIKSFISIGSTLTMTTVILSISFVMYTTSIVNAWIHLGILAPIGLLVALIADYTLTPVLILITHPFGKENK